MAFLIVHYNNTLNLNESLLPTDLVGYKNRHRKWLSYTWNLKESLLLGLRLAWVNPLQKENTPPPYTH